MNVEQTRFLTWSVIVGVVGPFGLYFAIALIATGRDDVSAPIDRGQFFLASVGVLAGVLQRLSLPRELLLADQRRANNVELAKGCALVAMLFAVALWIMITLGAITEAEWAGRAHGVAWFGVVFLGLCCSVGYKALGLLR